MVWRLFSLNAATHTSERMIARATHHIHAHIFTHHEPVFVFDPFLPAAPDGEEYMLATDAAKSFGKSMHEVFGM